MFCQRIAANQRQICRLPFAGPLQWRPAPNRVMLDIIIDAFRQDIAGAIFANNRPENSAHIERRQ
jgi:hypothetical protein